MKENVRYNFASGSHWEPLRGYSRAVKIGNSVFISGTTAVDEKGEVVAAGDAYEQTRYIIQKVRDVLAMTELELSDVVRTRLFVTNMAKWDEYARAHREAFENIRPASSIVQVTKLVDPRLMIEMEIDAVGGSQGVENIVLAPRRGAARP
ncbi:MAG: RidA family protein [Deltaproteobacteria bacterium]|nr:RidA family protein [Deltaproteobacteria bacterium]